MVAIVEKAKNAGISLYPGEIDALKRRAKLRDGGSPTRYFRRLFEADMEGEPAPTAYDPEILTKLATTYAGYLAPRLDHALKGTEADQPETLHRILVALGEHLARGCDPADLVIVPRSEWTPAPPVALMAAEDPAEYKTKGHPKSPAAKTPPATSHTGSAPSIPTAV